MHKPLFAAAAFAVATCVGCSTTHDRQATESVSSDGMTATRTRSQIRETPSGATVKETETQTRQVIQSPTTSPDATKRDPAK